MGKIELDDLNWERRSYNAWRAYGQSKLANLLFTLELENRLTAARSPVRALAAHPGWAATNLQGRTQNRLQDLFMTVGNKVIAQDDEHGAWPTLYAATQDLPGGSYVGPDGFQEGRGHPTLVGPLRRGERPGDGPRALGRLRGAHRRHLPARRAGGLRARLTRARAALSHELARPFAGRATKWTAPRRAS